jgi:hypothetical protein
MSKLKGKPTKIARHFYGTLVSLNDIGLRPAPEPIRRSAAWWALYNSLATIAPRGHGFIYASIGEDALSINGPTYLAGIRKFNHRKLAESAIPILGGAETITHYLSEGDLMSAWLGEQ